MDRVDKALRALKEGNTCSQAIVSTYAEDLGLNKELALKISCSFGGGMGCQGYPTPVWSRATPTARHCAR